MSEMGQRVAKIDADVRSGANRRRQVVPVQFDFRHPGQPCGNLCGTIDAISFDVAGGARYLPLDQSV